MNDLAQQLHDIIPNGILDHYADQQKLTRVGVCGVLILHNSEWADRLFNDNALFSLDDVMHDFVGLMHYDEHFVSRI